MDFTIFDNEDVEPFLAGLEGEERRGGRPLPPLVDQDLMVIIIIFCRYLHEIYEIG